MPYCVPLKSNIWFIIRGLSAGVRQDAAIYILHIGCAFCHISVVGYIEEGEAFVKMS